MRNGSIVYLAISGMDCDKCRIWVRNSLCTLDGVSRVHIDPRKNVAKIIFNPELTTLSAIEDTIVQTENDGWHQYEVVPLDYSEILN